MSVIYSREATFFDIILCNLEFSCAFFSFFNPNIGHFPFLQVAEDSTCESVGVRTLEVSIQSFFLIATVIFSMHEYSSLI